MHITSLPEKHGIGTLGRCAFDFVDFLAESGIRAWQVLPVAPAGSENSPYKPFSSHAGNALLIDLEELCELGLISKDALSGCVSLIGGRIDYSGVNEYKSKLLREAWRNNCLKNELRAFEKQHSFWLYDYALFMAIKDVHGGAPWYRWEHDIRFRIDESLRAWRNKLKAEADYYCFEQMLFYRQWSRLKKYANSKGVMLIGDIPIYVSEDSADIWANPGLFMLDGDLNPISVAGCPPDGFCAEGQLWGNPLYNWEVLENTGFNWWIQRMLSAKELFNIVRIDHFRGFDAYWAIPFKETTAQNGRWVPGPGNLFFDAVREAVGKFKVIAEDLGFLTPSVYKLRNRYGFPGMKVLQFAFNSGAGSVYLPHNYVRNCAVYTGTHDNDTVLGWGNSACYDEVAFALEYLNVDSIDNLPWAFIRAAWSSVAKYAIAQMQDFLCLDTSARMNIPGIARGNWEWQMLPDALTPELSRRIYNITECYGRLH